MVKIVKLGGGKEIKLAANAATPFRFKQLFGSDLLRLFQQSSKSEEESVLMADVLTQMAFVMNKQAEGADLNSMSMDDFYTWLEDYEAMDFVNAGAEIIGTYMVTTIPSVASKKK